MKVVVFGTGYVGLVSGVCLAEVGHDVTCIDINKSIVKSLNRGISTISESKISTLLLKNIKNNRFKVTGNQQEAMQNAQVSIIAVGTPFDGHKIDLSYIEKVAKSIGSELKNHSSYHVVCVKSTIVPGTTDNIIKPIIEKSSGKKCDEAWGLAMNPEFLAEGTAINDFMHPDRIVIGAEFPRTFNIMKELYSPFKNSLVLSTNIATAEMIKYASNTFLASIISFSNEIASLCDVNNKIDILDVMSGVHADKRLSPILKTGRVKPGLLSFLHPGVGFGGSCFPKDVKSIISYASEMKLKVPLLKAVINVNDNQVQVLIRKIVDNLQIIKGQKITILGLAFKPGTDDIRESPSIKIIKALLSLGAKIQAHDPKAIKKMKGIFSNEKIYFSEVLDDVLEKTSAIVLLTAWPEYKDLHFKSIAQKVPVIDGRRFLEKKNFKHYVGIGYNSSKSSNFKIQRKK
tara:strand:- start:3514 stop:4887 length:1374 start_codon:yes stop_codon:yes gene_type:complete